MGVLIGGAAIFSLQWIQEVWHFIVLYGLLGALGFVSAGGFVSATVVSKWFVRLRGRALGILAFVLAAGVFLGVPFVGLLESTVGWRRAWAIVGVIF